MPVDWDAASDRATTQRNYSDAVTPPLPWGCEGKRGSVLLVPTITLGETWKSV